MSAGKVIYLHLNRISCRRSKKTIGVRDASIVLVPSRRPYWWRKKGKFFRAASANRHLLGRVSVRIVCRSWKYHRVGKPPVVLAMHPLKDGQGAQMRLESTREEKNNCHSPESRARTTATGLHVRSEGHLLAPQVNILSWIQEAYWGEEK